MRCPLVEKTVDILWISLADNVDNVWRIVDKESSENDERRKL
jgi:hypothetical protein